MSATRKVSVIVTRYYSKQTTVEIDVPVDIKDDELVDFLTENEDLDVKIAEGLAQDSLSVDDDTFEYWDKDNEIGGTL
jgi:hypothetical protein